MHTESIEEKFGDKIPDIGLGKSISTESGNVRIFGIGMNSSRRLSSFYVLGLVMLVIVFVFLIFAKPNRPPIASNAPATLPAQVQQK